MSDDLHPSSFRYFITEEIYLIEEKSAQPKATQKEVPSELPVQKVQPVAETAPKRQHLIIILKHNLSNLEPTQKDLLTKITGAVKIDLNTTTSINESQYKADPGQLDGFDNILSFGVELSATISKYSVIKKGDQKLLASDSLAALEQAIALKGKLWKAMQEMFAVA